MLRETLDVVAVADDKLEVRFNKRNMCSCCQMYKLCGRGQDSLIIDKPNFLLKKGDKVQVVIDERKTVFANLIIFLVPAAIFLSVLILGRRINETSSFFLAIVAVLFYYVVVKLVLKTQGNKFNIQITGKA